MKNNVGIFLLGAALALGLVSSAAIVAVCITNISNRKLAAIDKTATRKLAAIDKAVGTASKTALKVTHSETIKVKGSASKMVDSDFGTWRGEVAACAVDRNAALELLDKTKQKIVAHIKDPKNGGFKESDIEWESISVTPLYRTIKDEKGVQHTVFDKFKVGCSLSISSSRVYDLEKLNRHFTDLLKTIDRSAEIGNLGASYIITDLDKYKMKLLEEATQNGSQRANILAGGKVGSLLSASQGVFQVLAPGAGNISDYGTYDKSTIKKEIKAVVTLEFSTR